MISYLGDTFYPTTITLFCWQYWKFSECPQILVNVARRCRALLDRRGGALVRVGKRAKPRCSTATSWFNRWIPAGETAFCYYILLVLAMLALEIATPFRVPSPIRYDYLERKKKRGTARTCCLGVRETRERVNSIGLRYTFFVSFAPFLIFLQIIVFIVTNAPYTMAILFLT